MHFFINIWKDIFISSLLLDFIPPSVLENYLFTFATKLDCSYLNQYPPRPTHSSSYLMSKNQ